LEDSAIIYGKSYGYIYICHACDAYVGCHKGTTNPLGTLADFFTRQARKAAHQHFDPIWKNCTLKRKEAYRRLGNFMKKSKRETHIAKFTIEECKRVLEFKTTGGEG
jgi:hypothetical protein